MQDREDLIRRRAHQIWQEQGCPEGQGDAHWQQAQEEIEGLADQGDADFGADTARRAGEDTTDAPKLTTTRESAAFAMANSSSSESR